MKKPDYMGFSSNTTDEEAKKGFRHKYGQKPAEVKRNNGAVRAGPIPKEAR